MRSTVRWLLPAAAAMAVFVLAGPVAASELAVDDPQGEDWYLPSAVEPGDAGPWVALLQERLADAGFRPGRVDGEFGKATLGAVYAFQKVHDLPRDGSFRDAYWELLGTDVELPSKDEVPDRVEIDLNKQVLFLVEDQEVKAVLPVSSGNGETYRGSTGSLVRARTPEGGYSFYRHIDGWRISYLGGLYRPYYFRGGYAIHGSSSVPPYPASHGCVRVELHDMDYLTTELNLGMPIYVYGQRLSRDEVLPPDPLPPPKWEDLTPGEPL